MTTVDKKTRILCVEDDPQMRAFLQAQLRARGFHVQVVRDGAQAVDLAAIFQPQLVLLDLALPSLDGLSFLRRLREWSRAPVIILSAHDEEPVKIKALDLGADDYLTKPFSTNELLARIRVALRRADETAHLLNNTANPQIQRPIYCCGGDQGLIVNFAYRHVISGGQEVHLTPTEYDLLSTLARHAGKVITHHELLQRVWGPDYAGENTYLRTFIRHLRRKLEPDPAQPRFLLNELGVGYYVPLPDSDMLTE
ncbi:MAG: response regulator transcription factor [Chloroflexota bacterium]|nr:response regulator transcription factor [Chloroflexota bacterium]